MGRQTAVDQVTGKGLGPETVPSPGPFPQVVQSTLYRTSQNQAAARTQVVVKLGPQDIFISHPDTGAPNALIAPTSSYAGVMVEVVPGDHAGGVVARLILKHPDPQFSFVLAETLQPERLAAVWSSWSSALCLPMLVGDQTGRVKPIEAFSARPAGKPYARRKLSLLTGRRPRFLVRRNCGKHPSAAQVHRGEREIIART